jgi:hypothetical protein
MTPDHYLKAIQPDYGRCDGPTNRTLPLLPSGTLNQKSCGKRLHPPYQLLAGGKRLYSDPCMNADDEAIHAELIKCQSRNMNYAKRKLRSKMTFIKAEELVTIINWMFSSSSCTTDLTYSSNLDCN